jgi:hypothetical protein
MEVIGELLEPFTTQLYAVRVEVALISIVVAFLLGVAAWRLGWFDAARRHPGRSAALAVAVLAVGLPIAWYMVSPVFLRSSLVETSPVGATSATLAPSTPPAPTPTGDAAAASSEPTPTPVAPTPTPAPTPFVPITLVSGEFEGTDDFHFGRGSASIIEVEPGRYHLRLEDFSVRNGPDLFVYLSPDPDGYDDDAIELGRLKATDGSFGYDLPDGADPADFASAIIWCKQFAHLFATATFETD